MSKRKPPTAVEQGAKSVTDVAAEITDLFTFSPARPGKRKAWDQLSDAYRKRLQRGGITAEEHARGASLSKPRGHTSVAKERARSAYFRSIDKYAKHMADVYGNYTYDEYRASLRRLPESQTRSVISTQAAAEALYEAGDTEDASEVWKGRPYSVIDNALYFYHGLYS